MPLLSAQVAGRGLSDTFAGSDLRNQLPWLRKYILTSFISSATTQSPEAFDRYRSSIGLAG